MFFTFPIICCIIFINFSLCQGYLPMYRKVNLYQLSSNPRDLSDPINPISLTSSISLSSTINPTNSKDLTQLSLDIATLSSVVSSVFFQSSTLEFVISLFILIFYNKIIPSYNFPYNIPANILIIVSSVIMALGELFGLGDKLNNNPIIEYTIVGLTIISLFEVIRCAVHWIFYFISLIL